MILSTHYQPALAIVCQAISECSRIDLFFLSPKTTASSLHVSLKERKSQLITSNSIYYSDAIISAMASQITSLTIVYSTVYISADQRKHQSSALLAFMWEFTDDRWIPRTKGQWRGKCFHLLTSSWYAANVGIFQQLLLYIYCCHYMIVVQVLYY